MKTKGLKYYKKGNFIYAEAAEYVIEFDFGMAEFGLVEIVIKACIGTSLQWKSNAREIKESTFLKYYRFSKKHNQFTPVL